ncbi:MAG: ORF6N domain-containing protein [Candidatus Moraniibacteriota bacterium]
MAKSNSMVLNERIISRIFLIRGKRVMFDKDLAELYQVRIMDLNKAVKINLGFCDRIKKPPESQDSGG